MTFELGLSEAATAEVVDRLTVPYMASNSAPRTRWSSRAPLHLFEYDDAGIRRASVDRSTIRLALGYVERGRRGHRGPGPRCPRSPAKA